LRGMRGRSSRGRLCASQRRHIQAIPARDLGDELCPPGYTAPYRSDAGLVACAHAYARHRQLPRIPSRGGVASRVFEPIVARRREDVLTHEDRRRRLRPGSRTLAKERSSTSRPVCAWSAGWRRRPPRKRIQ
jgi:hypothetical protein